MAFNLSKQFNPGDNFYMYVNNNWIEKTKLPEEERRWGSFNILVENNTERIKSLLEENLNSSNMEYKMVTLLYDQAMNSNSNQNETVKFFLDEMADVQTKDQLQNFIYRYFFENGLGMPINFSSFSDFSDADMNILHISSGGLGLPDRDYYLEEDKKEHLEKYTEFLNNYSKLFNLNLDVNGILKLETEFAKNTYSNVQKRNPEIMNNPSTFEKVNQEYSELNINKIFDTLNITPEKRKINLINPNFLKNGKNGFIELWNSISLTLWKDYFTLSFLRQTGSYINLSTEELLFNFYSKHLSGTKEMKPLWKRSVSKCESLLGMVIGKMYVRKYFNSEAKEKVLQMIEFIKNVFRLRLENSSWMTSETKEKALEKLSKMNFKIGYPDIWREFTNVGVSHQNSFFKNVLNCLRFETKFDNCQLYKPTDKSLWFMDPQDVNAYYSPSYNEIVFPAGILQDPFFSVNNDMGMNFGGIGAVIAHEITHGFDDQGKKYDSDGNLNDWWNDVDDQNFKKETGKLKDLFSSYKLFGKNVNGDLTLGENIADLGGVTIAYNSLIKYLKEFPNEDIIIDKFNLKQRFFFNYANIWKSKSREEDILQRLLTDPHSPPEFRVNGILIHLDEFYQAFNIKEDSKLFLKNDERTSIF